MPVRKTRRVPKQKHTRHILILDAKKMIKTNSGLHSTFKNLNQRNTDPISDKLVHHQVAMETDLTIHLTRATTMTIKIILNAILTKILQLTLTTEGIEIITAIEMMAGLVTVILRIKKLQTIQMRKTHHQNVKGIQGKVDAKKSVANSIQKGQISLS